MYVEQSSHGQSEHSSINHSEESSTNLSEQSSVNQSECRAVSQSGDSSTCSVNAYDPYHARITDLPTSHITKVYFATPKSVFFTQKVYFTNKSQKDAHYPTFKHKNKYNSSGVSHSGVSSSRGVSHSGVS